MLCINQISCNLRLQLLLHPTGVQRPVPLGGNQFLPEMLPQLQWSFLELQSASARTATGTRGPR